MAFYREQTGELLLKILYVGASGSGKTSNFKALYHHTKLGPLNWTQKQFNFSRCTAPFDFLPLKLGEIRSCHTVVHLFSLPPLDLWPVTEQTLLRGVDGLIFICDSRPQNFWKTCLYLEKLEKLIFPLTKNEVPRVYQWNFKDSKKTLSLNALQVGFNQEKHSSVEAVAATGLGVVDTLNVLVQRLLTQMENSQKNLQVNQSLEVQESLADLRRDAAFDL